MSPTVSQIGEGKELKHKPIVLVTNYKHNFMNGKYTLQIFIAGYNSLYTGPAGAASLSLPSAQICYTQSSHILRLQ
jgi:hypothetical protein